MKEKSCQYEWGTEVQQIGQLKKQENEFYGNGMYDQDDIVLLAYEVIWEPSMGFYFMLIVITCNEHGKIILT